MKEIRPMLHIRYLRQVHSSFYAGKKVLITGGLGMIGSNLAIELVKLDAKVTILDKTTRNLFNINKIRNNVELVLGDITDKNFIVKNIKGIDVIFHLAARVSQFPKDSEILKDMKVNRISHLLMLESLRKYNDKAIIIFSGSRLEYGKPKNLPVKEDHPLNPINFYGIDKLAAEKYYLLYYNIYGIKSVCFRITNPYGPRSQMRTSSFNIVNWFIRKALDNEIIQIYGNGEQLRDYIYVRDLINGLLTAITHKKAIGLVFNIGSGKGIKFKDMANLIVKIVGKGKVEHIDWPIGYGAIETGNFVADISKIRKLGWKLKIPLADGIKKTVDYYRATKSKYW